jgi:hypothetical protein
MKSMARLGNWLRLAALLGVFAMFVTQIPNAAAGVDMPEPTIAQAKGGHCVRDDAYIMRHHPDMLRHQRDNTLRLGIRAGDFNLMRCMECHSNNAADPAELKTDCDNCHAYAAVHLDCWDCHAKRPDKHADKVADQPSASPLIASVRTGANGERK